MNIWSKIIAVLGIGILFAGCLGKPVKHRIHGNVGEPVLGIRLKVITEESVFKDVGAEGRTHLLVINVKPDSPAQKAGIRQGDQLLKMDGERVYGIQDSVSILKRRQPGDPMELEIRRDGKKMKKKVIMGAKQIPDNRYIKEEDEP